MSRSQVSRGADEFVPRGSLVTAVGVLGAALAIVVGSYLWRARTDGPADAPPPSTGDEIAAVSDRGAVEPAPARSNRSEIERLIRVFERRVEMQPNALDLTFLARLYVDKGRLTGDVTTYVRARTALRRSLGIWPEDPDARSLLASVRYTMHDFAGALGMAEQLVRDDPGDSAARAVLGDALLELGRYEAATETYERLDRDLPGVAAVDARLSRLAWLRGDVGEATSLAAFAAQEASDAGAFGAGLAWYRAFEAHLAFETGTYRQAARLYAAALRAAPDYHVALAGLARARAAMGEIPAAMRLYERAIGIVPQPDYLAALGDLHARRGDAREARSNYQTLGAIARLGRAGGPVFDRQLALFYADHGLHTDRALRLTRSELAVRKDVYGYDAYAWALYENGRFRSARKASDRALSLGTRDARLLYHAGMISAALGDDERAREELSTALDLNPAFDPLQSDKARARLQSLGGGRR